MPSRDIDDERLLRLRTWVVHRHEDGFGQRGRSRTNTDYRNLPSIGGSRGARKGEV